MKKAKGLFVLVISLIIIIGIHAPIFAGEPNLPPIPPCPIYGTGGRSIDPPLYDEEK
ncbi:MAG: hypothetical protein FWC95_07020 [Defluviitaleaceae bacterium]|nr:hypothetical protein [Defluviitaleaceae bacterium]